MQLPTNLPRNKNANKNHCHITDQTPASFKTLLRSKYVNHFLLVHLSTSILLNYYFFKSLMALFSLCSTCSACLHGLYFLIGLSENLAAAAGSSTLSLTPPVSASNNMSDGHRQVVNDEVWLIQEDDGRLLLALISFMTCMRPSG